MLPSLSVRKPYTVLVAVVLILVLGVISFIGMSTDLLPGIELPYVVVMTTYPGASPEKVELTVTRPLEAVLSTASGLSNISSISRENSSLVILEFVQGINMDSVMIELSGSLDRISALFDNAVGAPILLKISPDMLPVMVASVDVAGMSLHELSGFVRDEVVPAFERIDGVASVTPSGLIEQQIHIARDADRIARFTQIVLDDLNSRLDATEAEIRQALADLEEGAATLAETMPEQQQKLIKAGADVDKAIAGLQGLLAEEASLKAQRAAFEQEKAIIMQMTQVQALLDQYFPDGVLTLTPEQFARLIADLAGQLPEQLQGKTQDELSQMALQMIMAMARLNAIEVELQNINVRMLTMQAMKPQLERSLAQAGKGLQEIESGKITLSTELAQAKIQLEYGRKELSQALTEFAAAREQAVKQADLALILTGDMIGRILMAQNFQMPAGTLLDGQDQVVVKVGDAYASQEELAATLLISLEATGDIRLRDIAAVTRRDNAAETYAKVNGNDGIVLTFQKQSTASTADVAGRIRAVIEQLSARHEGLRILPLMDQGAYIDIIIKSVLQNLLWGGLLSILILLLFLRDLRPTLVIAISIPVSLLFAVTLMYFSDVTLNIISLSGLALGIGMLVDNSIVVIENIYRLRHEGMPAGRAAVVGARQMSGAIIASTLTTVCVFLPIVFTQGLSRQLFADMGLTIAYSLLASLAVALTVVPAMSATALRRSREKKHRLFDRMTGAYRSVLAFSLRFKAVVLIPTVLLFGLSLYGVTVMGTAFMPEMDSPQLSATLTMPQGSDRDLTYATADAVMNAILQIEAVEYVGVLSGGAGFMGGGAGMARANTLSFYILLRDRRSQTNREVEREILDRTAALPGTLSVSATTMNLGMLGGSGVSVMIKGQNIDDLRTITADIRHLLSQIEGLVNIAVSLDDSGTEMRVTVDKDAALRENLTVAQIYQELATALQRDKQAIVLTEGRENVPVLLAAAKEPLTRASLADYAFTVTDRDGTTRSVRLADLAKIEEAPSLSAIRRDNQSRYATVTASLDEGYNIGLVSRDLEASLAGYAVPEGFRVEIGGENVMIQDAMRDVTLMVALAVLFIYLIMVAQFQSLLAPFIVLFTLPLAFTGGLLLLWAVGMELSVVAALGFLVLAGVVVNNGIVFVSSVNQLRESGRDRLDALLETGVTRIRPILMTAVTTILAMSTLGLGLGSGAEMTQPMAVVTIGGLTYATLLTLLVVPVIYDLLHKRPMVPIDIGEHEEEHT
jgi:HAE1 family hydrophobic/amphiphilic exporter-1